MHFLSEEGEHRRVVFGGGRVALVLADCKMRARPKGIIVSQRSGLTR